MGYLVVEAKLSDVPDIVSTFFDAFRDDHIIRQIWHCVPQDISFAYQCRRFAKHFDNMDRDGTVYRKAVDEDTGKLVGFAKWQYPHTLTPEQKVEKHKAEKDQEPSPEGTNLELRKDFFGALAEKRKNYVDDTKDYVLLLLGVAPTHQRMGLGTLLINEGLAVADENNAKTYIEASPKGLGLYLKHGWKLVDEIVLDMRQYGDSGVAKEQCLIRKPGGKSAFEG